MSQNKNTHHNNISENSNISGAQALKCKKKMAAISVRCAHDGLKLLLILGVMLWLR